MDTDVYIKGAARRCAVCHGCLALLLWNPVWLVGVSSYWQVAVCRVATDVVGCHGMQRLDDLVPEVCLGDLGLVRLRAVNKHITVSNACMPNRLHRAMYGFSEAALMCDVPIDRHCGSSS